MKIRTITTGFNLRMPLKENQIGKIAKFTNYARREFEDSGFDVQTVRIATQPWEQYYRNKKQMVELVKKLDDLTKKYSIDYFNIGSTKNQKNIPLIYDLLKNTTTMFCTSLVCDNKKIDYEIARQSAKLVKRLSRISSDGFDNLRFASLFNTKPGSPFYPGAYHRGPMSFAVGCENSDLVNKAFSKAKNIKAAQNALEKILNAEYGRIEKVAENISKIQKIRYGGIDVSIASSVKANESLAFAFEKLGLGRFGQSGTLAVSKIVTDALKNLKVKRCGYSGLMLPVLEDYGLAKRNTGGEYDIMNLLLYSAVCGTGLDTIPLSGDVSTKRIYALLLDMASLSIKLDKPLSARLMPVPGKKTGELTNFQFPYFANTKTMKL